MFNLYESSCVLDPSCPTSTQVAGLQFYLLSELGLHSAGLLLRLAQPLGSHPLIRLLALVQPTRLRHLRGVQLHSRLHAARLVAHLVARPKLQLPQGGEMWSTELLAASYQLWFIRHRCSEHSAESPAENEGGLRRSPRLPPKPSFLQRHSS